VTHGIDSRHVAPLDVGVIYEALRRISTRLKNGREFIIECLADEINEDYMISVKRAIIDFVLRNPRDDEFEKVSVYAQRPK
jgi:dynein heavy chain